MRRINLCLLFWPEWEGTLRSVHHSNGSAFNVSLVVGWRLFWKCLSEKCYLKLEFTAKSLNLIKKVNLSYPDISLIILVSIAHILTVKLFSLLRKALCIFKYLLVGSFGILQSLLNLLDFFSDLAVVTTPNFSTFFLRFKRNSAHLLFSAVLKLYI